MPPMSQREETAVLRRTSGRDHGHTACAGAARGVAWTSQGLGGVWGCGCLWPSTVALLPPPDAPSRQAGMACAGHAALAAAMRAVALCSRSSVPLPLDGGVRLGPPEA